jgi:predicted nuclease with TOPRIM domain
MNNQDVQALNMKASELRDTQQEVSTVVTEMLNMVATLEKRFDEHFNLSFVLSELRSKLESIDVDGMFDFINDLESEIESLSYNYKRAEKANNVSVYKIKNAQFPMYFKPKE